MGLRLQLLQEFKNLLLKYQDLFPNERVMVTIHTDEEGMFAWRRKDFFQVQTVDDKQVT